MKRALYMLLVACGGTTTIEPRDASTDTQIDVAGDVDAGGTAIDASDAGAKDSGKPQCIVGNGCDAGAIACVGPWLCVCTAGHWDVDQDAACPE